MDMFALMIEQRDAFSRGSRSFPHRHRLEVRIQLKHLHEHRQTLR